MNTKRLIITVLPGLLVTLFCGFADAQTLKALLVIEDNYDDPGLNSIAPSTRMDYGYVSKLLENLDAKGVIDVEKTLVSGTNATKDNIIALIENLFVGPDDVLLVYFSGHGGMAGTKTFLATSEGGSLYRQTVEDLVEAKPARLKIVISDACSSSIDGIGPKSSFKKKDMEDLESAFTEIYKNLFLNHEGLLYVTSASPGQYAWGGNSGGNFTQSLFYETMLQDPKLTWQEVFDQASDKTEEKFRYMVNMGHVSPQDLAEMNAKGIDAQTPKAYSMAVKKGTEAVAIDENKIDAIADDPPPASGSDLLTFLITNSSGKKVSFWVDGNLQFDGSWSLDNCSEYTLKKNDVVAIKAREPITIFFDNRGDDFDFYHLAPGEYEFGLDSNKLLALYEHGTYDEEEIKDGSPIVGTWAWEIYIPDTNSFMIILLTFNDDRTLSVTDLDGNELMWGKYKSKVKKHTEHLTLTLDDGVEVTTDKLVATYFDENTVQLTDPKDPEGEVIMLYRLVVAETTDDYNPAHDPAGVYNPDAYSSLYWDHAWTEWTF